MQFLGWFSFLMFYNTKQNFADLVEQAERKFSFFSFINSYSCVISPCLFGSLSIGLIRLLKEAKLSFHFTSSTMGMENFLFFFAKIFMTNFSFLPSLGYRKRFFECFARKFFLLFKRDSAQNK